MDGVRSAFVSGIHHSHSNVNYNSSILLSSSLSTLSYSTIPRHTLTLALRRRPSSSSSNPQNSNSKSNSKHRSLLCNALTSLSTSLSAIDLYLSADQTRLILAGSLALTVGYFAATVVITIVGEQQDWDSVAGAVLLLITESFTRLFYSRVEVNKSPSMIVINTFKVGLVYGLIYDAFRLAVKV
mmetsp:Transcript_6061/g.10778  ORF Transcript_6061/g.10778 Transcript_6061/m.10778 type:complete len:184 (+) Transcript_6061:126-677(+)